MKLVDVNGIVVAVDDAKAAYMVATGNYEPLHAEEVDAPPAKRGRTTK